MPPSTRRLHLTRHAAPRSRRLRRPIDMSALEQFSLRSKVAIVTGASSGLGVAIAEGLAQAGADVALGARRLDRLHETAERITNAGRRAHVVQADVSKVDDCARLVQ